MRRAIGCAAVVTFAACAMMTAGSAAHAQMPAHLTRYVQQSGTHEDLLAVSAFSNKIAWASGTHGTILRTTDGGKTWKSSRTPSGDSLDFSNVYAINDKQAFVMSVGAGRRSRIYKTMDGGAHWIPRYMNIEPDLIWKCFAFWNADHGVGLSEVQKGDFLLTFTIDGGETWDRVPADSFPAPLPHEQTMAPTPSCLHTGWGPHAWFATTLGRVMRTSNYGNSWKMAFVHIGIGDDNIINSLLFHDVSNGLLFGEARHAPGLTVIAESTNGGKSWQEREPITLPTPLATVAYVRDLDGPTLAAVGPRGAIYSRDNGLTWLPIDQLSYNALDFARRDAGWAVGANGVITKITF
jgi:photosystem II stability/assembly factor-like uncharacterized protein